MLYIIHYFFPPILEESYLELYALVSLVFVDVSNFLSGFLFGKNEMTSTTCSFI
jgi:hypothetical protein